jgi:hypothetical protein
MTTLGKALIVIQLCFSLFFMAFAGAVYTAHSNWMTKFTKAQKDLLAEQGKVQNLQTEIEQERTASNAKIKQLEDNLNLVTGERNNLQGENTRLLADNKTLQTALDGQREVAKLNSEEANERIAEAMTQREQNSLLYQSRNGVIGDLKKLEDDVFAMNLQREQLEEKYDQLLKERQKMVGYLALHKMETDPKKMVAGAQPPTDVDGVVLRAEKAEKGTNEFVEISVGSDDDLREGHELTVFNHEKYLGRIKLIRVTPDKSVGLVIDKAKNTVIQRGDNVTTKL